MLDHSPLQIGSLTLPNRLVQGPLAGFSCAPFRSLFYQFEPPAYCVSEMLSAHDVVHKHRLESRYLARDPVETTLCYQIAGSNADLMAEAAVKLQALGADLIDINCGCPKTKIRKKGAGSALLDTPETLQSIVYQVKKRINIPLTVKIRLQGGDKDSQLTARLADAGADALIVHARRWQDDYVVPPDWQQLAQLKQQTNLPIIANGDIHDLSSALTTWQQTGCDGLMISRAGTGKPWLYQQLLRGETTRPFNLAQQLELFMTHLTDLAELESEYQAVLQSKRLVRYYFRPVLEPEFLQEFYGLKSLDEIKGRLIHDLMALP